MSIINPGEKTIEKMKVVDAYKKDRYTFREIAKFIGHSQTYTKNLHLFYRKHIKENHE